MTIQLHQAVDHTGVVWFSAPTADDLLLALSTHYDRPLYCFEIDGDEVMEVEEDGTVRSSWTYVVADAPTPIPSTIAFVHGLHARLNDFVAEDLIRPDADFPIESVVADFLSFEYDAPSLSRTELAIVHAVIADLLHTLPA